MIELAHSFMLENIKINLKMGDMYKYFLVSRRTFELAFKKEYGETPATYFKHLKIKHIVITLRRSGRRIGDVLDEYGVNQHGHFAGYYKRLYGENLRDTLKRE